MSDERFPTQRNDEMPVIEPAHPSKLVRRGLSRLAALDEQAGRGTLGDSVEQGHLLWTFAAYSRRHSELADGRPDVPPLYSDAIPRELTERRQWVCWEWGKRAHRRANDGGAEWGKFPISPVTGGPEQGPATWGSFDDALAFRRRHGVAGIGFAFTREDPYVGIDLDQCRDPLSGALKPWEASIVERLSSYTEVSPSGAGVHIVVKGKVTPFRPILDAPIPELFVTGGFLTFTGDHLANTPATVLDRQSLLEEMSAALREGHYWDISIVDDDYEAGASGRFVSQLQVGPSGITLRSDLGASVCLDDRTGQPVTAAIHPEPIHEHASVWNGIHVTRIGNEFQGHDEMTDRHLWHHTFSSADFGDVLSWVVIDGLVLVCTEMGTLSALDARNGNRLWLLEEVFPPVSFLIHGSLTVSGTTNGVFKVIDIRTGEVFQAFQGVEGGVHSRVLTLTADLVLFQTGQGVGAWGLHRGDQVWFYRRPQQFGTFPSWLSDHFTYFVIPGDDVYPMAVENAALIDVTLYVGDGIDHLIALDLITGRERWRFPIGGAAQFVGVADDALYVANSHVLHAIRLPSANDQ
ncbi:MAG: PQQ-binding-like beta-propeller repeat protein [Thermomicrobiales bacterium]